ncbi:hypothetical protein DXB46_16145 [Lachnospiraceae bacterium OM04-12BH]|nr:hypothetical protein DXB46_16145 [Lachnospiraceae bacterium OM04-12BH]
MQYISLLYIVQVEKIATPGSIKPGILSPEKQIAYRLLFEELHRGLEIMRDKSEYYNKVTIVR